MNQKLLYLRLLLLLLVCWGVHGDLRPQVTIGAKSAPHKFSVLEISTATTKGGLRLIQLTSAQRDDLNDPSTPQNIIGEDHQADPGAGIAPGLALGLTIYNTDTNCLEFWNGKKWVSMCDDVCTAPTTPLISSSSTTVGELCNGSATLTASSAGAKTYQWYKDGAIVAGAIAVTYTATATGTYTVKAMSGICESDLSAGFAITTDNVTPVLAWSGTPVADAVAGQNYTYTATLTSASAGLTYTWAVTNGTVVSGQGTASAVISFTSAGTGTVSCTATNICGSTSNTLSQTVAVCTAPATPLISSSSTTAGQLCNGSATLTASSAGATSYQWYKDGTIVAGAIAVTYNATATGTYTVKAMSGICESAVSAGFVITSNNVTPVLAWSGTPVADAVAGQNYTYTATLTSASAGLTYTWAVTNGTVVSGQGTASAVISFTSAGTATVSCTATNTCGSTSNTLSQTVAVCTAPATPLISSASGNILCNGSTTLTASSAGATSYQWYKDGAIVAGATAGTYTATAVGTYTVKAKSGICESAVSAGFVITSNNVTPVLAWSGTPVADAVAGQNYTYTATLTSVSVGLTYTWTVTGGTVVSGQGTASAVISFTSAGTGTVSCTATNTCGSTSNTLSQTVAVCTAPATPTISSASGNILCNGSTTLTASSAGATSYQWYKDGAMLSGQIAVTYTATSAGTYSVKAVNGICESASSAGFALAVVPTPTISSTGPIPVCNYATLTAASVGATSYQWYLAGTLISGASSSSYTTNVAGSYTAIALSGSCQSAASVAFNLTAVAKPTPCGACLALDTWKEFMCHNLGADTSLDAFDLSSAGAMAGGLNGNYYQWGRATVVATATTPPAAIAGWNTTLAPDDAWMDAIKTANDPCPSGFRIPTNAQWAGVLNAALNPVTRLGSWSDSSTNYTTGIKFGPGVLLPAAGFRHRNNERGQLNARGFVGYYWSSTQYDGSIFVANYFYFNSGALGTYGENRATGLSVRCIYE